MGIRRDGIEPGGRKGTAGWGCRRGTRRSTRGPRRRPSAAPRRTSWGKPSIAALATAGSARHLEAHAWQGAPLPELCRGLLTQIAGTRSSGSPARSWPMQRALARFSTESLLIVAQQNVRGASRSIDVSHQYRRRGEALIVRDGLPCRIVSVGVASGAIRTTRSAPLFELVERNGLFVLDIRT